MIFPGGALRQFVSQNNGHLLFIFYNIPIILGSFLRNLSPVQPGNAELT